MPNEHSKTLTCLRATALVLLATCGTALAQSNVKIIAADPAEFYGFGNAVDINGEWAIIGSQGHHQNGVAANKGAAYFFQLSGSNWVQRNRFFGEGVGHLFGFDVAIDGSYAIAGAPGANAAYIYELVGNNWQLHKKISPGDPEAGDAFGVSVDIDGDYAIAGNVQDDTLGLGHGSAYVFKRSGANWLQQQKLTGSPLLHEGIGGNCVLHGEYAAVSSLDSLATSGYVHIFKRNGSVWTHQSRLQPSGHQLHDGLGSPDSVALYGEYLLAGTPGSDELGSSAGAAVLFKRNGTSWSEVAKLFGSDTVSLDKFGQGVAMNRDFALIGAYRKDGVGAAYYFQRCVTGLVELASIARNDLVSPTNYFADAVALDAGYAVIGDAKDFGFGESSGAAYVYDLRTLSTSVVDIAIGKTVDDDNPTGNDTIIYIIAASNNSPVVANDIAITDHLPGQVAYSSAVASLGIYNETNGIWTIAALNPHSNATLSITVTVNAGTSGEFVINTARLTSVSGSECYPANDEASVGIHIGAADLALSKRVDNASPNVGDTLIFTLSITNSGPEVTQDVRVGDALPNGLSYVSDDSGGAYVSNVWTVGTLSPGQFSAVNIAVSVTGTEPMTNTAQVSASSLFDPDSDPNNNVESEDDQQSVVITPQRADLSLIKTVSDALPPVGTQVVYSIVVSNAGPDTATSVAVVDMLPAGVSHLSNDSGGDYSPGTGLWNVGDLNAGETVSLNLNVQVDIAGPITNAAQVSAVDQFDPDSSPNNNALGEDDQDEVVIVGQLADLGIRKQDTPDISVLAGQALTYVITVTNAGPSDVAAAVVTDLLPVEFSLTNAFESQGLYTLSNGVWSVGGLSIGQSATLTLQGIVEAGTPAGTISNTATIHSEQPDPEPGDNSATAETDVIPVVTLTIAASPGEKGSPSPLGYGVHLLPVGTLVSNQVETLAEATDQMREVNTGWTGSGDVPPNGTGQSVSFTLTQNSMLTWHWQKQYPIAQAFKVPQSLKSSESKKVPADIEDFDQFGNAIDIDGDYVVIGDQGDDDVVSGGGAAWIYHCVDGGWHPQAKLTIPAADADFNDFFGFTVGIHGDRAIVGAFGARGFHQAGGAAYVYKRNGTNWPLEAKLFSASDAINDRVGQSVGIYSNYATLGAIGDDTPGGDAGAGYVFVRNGSVWTEQAKFLGHDTAGGDALGTAIAIDGDTLIIGAGGDADAGARTGSAYVFKRDGTNWVQQAKLTASDAAASADFGRAIALQGDMAVIGAPHLFSSTSPGKAYVFVREGTNWTETTQLIASDTSNGDEFGGYVAVSGNRIMVGAYQHDIPVSGAGAAYVFKRNGTNWPQETKLSASDAGPIARYGISVAISGKKVGIGSSGAGPVGKYHGAAYFYAFDSVGIASETISWWPSNAIGKTVTAPTVLYAGGSTNYFTRWELDGVRQPNATAVSVNPVIGIPMTRAYEACGIFKPRESDTDANGLEDWFEEQYFPAGGSSPTNDSDGDGQTDGQEQEAGTDPNSLGSLFKVSGAHTPASTGSMTNFTFTVSTVPNRKYTIQYVDQSLCISPIPWMFFANPGNGVGMWTETNHFPASFTFIDDFTVGTSGAAPTNSTRHYRMLVTRP